MPMLVTLCVAQTSVAQCDTSSDLSAVVTQFEYTQISRVDALLRFGQSRNLCFGIEYVSGKLLTEMTDFHIHDKPVHEVIESILGATLPLTIRMNNGVVDIGYKTSPGEPKSVFAYILPRFEAQGATVQEISTGLHLQLVADLNPQITGFAGHFSPGDVKNLAGPFSEKNRSVRYLLDDLIAKSKGGAWIATVGRKSNEDLTIVQRRRVWTIVEYAVPSTGYAPILNSVASDLDADPPPHAKDKKVTLQRKTYF